MFLENQLDFNSIQQILEHNDFLFQCYNINSYATKCNIYLNYKLPETIIQVLETIVHNFNFSVHACPIVNNCKLRLVITIEKPEITLMYLEPPDKRDIEHIVYIMFHELEDLFPVLFTSSLLVDVYDVYRTNKFMYQLKFKHRTKIQKALLILYAVIYMEPQNHVVTEDELVHFAENKLKEKDELKQVEIKLALLYLYQLIETKHMHVNEKDKILQLIKEDEFLRKLLLDKK